MKQEKSLVVCKFNENLIKLINVLIVTAVAHE